MNGADLVLFGNVSQPPFCNNLYPPLRALQKAFRTALVEPATIPGFVSTGGAKPALVPDEAVVAHTDPPPEAIVCLGGGLHLSKHARRMFPRYTAFAAFALSDPYGLEASFAIAPEFDFFYTQDPQTLPDYAGRGIAALRCDPATDPELYRPLKAAPECDILYYGKWTPYRNDLVEALAAHFSVRVHAYAGDTRWSVPVRPPLETPDALCAALNGARLALETALVDDVHGKYRGTFRITPRAFFAASCGVPTLVEAFPRLCRVLRAGSRNRRLPVEGRGRSGRGDDPRPRARPARHGPSRPPAGPARAHLGPPRRVVRAGSRPLAQEPQVAPHALRLASP